MLRNAKVHDALADHRAALTAEADVDGQELIRVLKAQAFGDFNELMELRRVACRYCHGSEHFYQETPAERRARREAHDHLVRLTPKREQTAIPPFDELGGVGYSAKRGPHPECPECFGDGDVRLLLKDTRELSAEAKCIYQGFKAGPHGVNILTVDRMKAIGLLGKVLGLFDGPQPAKPLTNASPELLTFRAIFPGGARN